LSLEPLAIPAYIVALATAFFWGAKAVMLVRGGSHPNGALAPEIRDALQATTLTLTKLTERLAFLPTKDELTAAAEKNRHAYRNDLATTQAVIVEQIDRTETVILRELARPA
jgi:hypothetical protein